MKCAVAVIIVAISQRDIHDVNCHVTVISIFHYLLKIIGGVRNSDQISFSSSSVVDLSLRQVQASTQTSLQHYSKRILSVKNIKHSAYVHVFFKLKNRILILLKM